MLQRVHLVLERVIPQTPGEILRKGNQLLSNEIIFLQFLLWVRKKLPGTRVIWGSFASEGKVKWEFLGYQLREPINKQNDWRWNGMLVAFAHQTMGMVSWPAAGTISAVYQQGSAAGWYECADRVIHTSVSPQSHSDVCLWSTAYYFITVLPVALREPSQGAEVGVNSLHQRLCPQQRFSQLLMMNSCFLAGWHKLLWILHKWLCYGCIPRGCTSVIYQ